MVNQKKLYAKCVKDVDPLPKPIKPLSKRQESKLNIKLNGQNIDVIFSIPRDILEDYLRRHPKDDPLMPF